MNLCCPINRIRLLIALKAVLLWHFGFKTYWITAYPRTPLNSRFLVSNFALQCQIKVSSVCKPTSSIDLKIETLFRGVPAPLGLRANQPDHCAFMEVRTSGGRGDGFCGFSLTTQPSWVRIWPQVKIKSFWESCHTYTPEELGIPAGCPEAWWLHGTLDFRMGPALQLHREDRVGRQDHQDRDRQNVPELL